MRTNQKHEENNEMFYFNLPFNNLFSFNLDF